MRGAATGTSFTDRHERRIALGLGVLAVLRLLWLGASFPLFANTDEHAHFDAVAKHAEGYLPRAGSAGYGAESAALMLLYRSPEYFHPGEPPPPLWQAPAGTREEVLREGVPLWTARTNHEVFQPPLYYLVAGGAYRLARGLGAEGGQLAHALRFLNAALFGLTFFVAWLFCRDLGFGGSGFRLSVLALLAVFPQDALFTIGNDAASPLFFLLALHGALKLRAPDAGLRAHAAAGAAAAAAFLVKFTNAAILPISLGLWLLARRERRAAGRAPPAAAGLAFALCLGVPVSLWLGWNAIVVDDPTGHAGVAGWTLKSASEVLEHPITGWEGASRFVAETTASFWRGELVWHGERLAWPLADAFYVSTTLLLVLVASLRLLRPDAGAPRTRRLVELAALFSIGSGVLLLAGVSVAYDFGDWSYPTRESPFLSSGRLLSGALVPFLVLYVGGLELLLRRVSPGASLLWVTAPLALLILVGELALAWPAAASPYNWLRL